MSRETKTLMIGWFERTVKIREHHHLEEGCNIQIVIDGEISAIMTYLVEMEKLEILP